MQMRTRHSRFETNISIKRELDGTNKIISDVK